MQIGIPPTPVTLLPKKDEPVPRGLSGCEGGCVIPQPLDVEASSWPPEHYAFHCGSKVCSGFVVLTPVFFAVEALES